MACMKLQKVETSHENQQNGTYCNFRYLILINSKHNCHNIFFLTSFPCSYRMSLARQQSMKLRHRKQLSGW